MPSVRLVRRSKKPKLYSAVNDWNPHQDPITAVVNTPATNSNKTAVHDRSVRRKESLPLNDINALALTATTAVTATDTDGDGLSDADEDYWLSCPWLDPSNEYCDGVVDPTDTDGDGLTDGEEIALGILPSSQDTDGDTISDTLEINGFYIIGSGQWYLDPADPDSNSDGLPDGAECPTLSATSGVFNPNGACRDIDQDGTPDIFDNDNDGDGVDDFDDISPNNGQSSQVTFDGDNPFNLAIDNLQIDQPVFGWIYAYDRHEKIT